MRFYFSQRTIATTVFVTMIIGADRLDYLDESDAGTGDSFGLGREGRGGSHSVLELDRGQPAECVLFAFAVVAALDPGHVRQA